MVIQPDFPNHWKTQTLCHLMEDPNAGMYVVRLWSFCQQRKAWSFYRETPRVFEAVCQWYGEPGKLWDAMLECRFIDVPEGGEDGSLGWEVHEWAEINARLVADWDKGKYGAKGGRPKKPRQNPQGFSVEPDKIREDKRRVQEYPHSPPTGGNDTPAKCESHSPEQGSPEEDGAADNIVLMEMETPKDPKREDWLKGLVNLFRRSGRAKPTETERRKWRKVVPHVTQEDYEVIRRFYGRSKAGQFDLTWKRKADLVTLLNQWDDQVQLACEYENAPPSGAGDVGSGDEMDAGDMASMMGQYYAKGGEA